LLTDTNKQTDRQTRTKTCTSVFVRGKNCTEHCKTDARSGGKWQKNVLSGNRKECGKV